MEKWVQNQVLCVWPHAPLMEMHGLTYQPPLSFDLGHLYFCPWCPWRMTAVLSAPEDTGIDSEPSVSGNSVSESAVTLRLSPLCFVSHLVLPPRLWEI